MNRLAVAIAALALALPAYPHEEGETCHYTIPAEKEDYHCHPEPPKPPRVDSNDAWLQVVGVGVLTAIAVASYVQWRKGELTARRTLTTTEHDTDGVGVRFMVAQDGNPALRAFWSLRF